MEVVEAVVDLESKKVMIKCIRFLLIPGISNGLSGSYEKRGETARI